MWVKVGARSTRHHLSVPVLSLCRAFSGCGTICRRVGYDYHIEGLIRIRQAEQQSCTEKCSFASSYPLHLGDHLRRGVVASMCAAAFTIMLCNQSRAGRQLQHRFVPHDRRIISYIVIRRPILSHKAVVTSGIFVPRNSCVPRISVISFQY